MSEPRGCDCGTPTTGHDVTCPCWVFTMAPYEAPKLTPIGTIGIDMGAGDSTAVVHLSEGGKVIASYEVKPDDLQLYKQICDHLVDVFAMAYGASRTPVYPERATGQTWTHRLGNRPEADAFLLGKRVRGGWQTIDQDTGMRTAVVLDDRCWTDPAITMTLTGMPGPDVRARDIWEWENGDRLFVHSRVPGSAAEWNTILDDSRVTHTVTMAVTQITEGARAKLLMRDADHAVPGGREIRWPPRKVGNEGAGAAPVAGAELLQQTTVQAPAPSEPSSPPPNCCRIGGEKAKDGQPCPLHPAAAARYTGEFDTFGFLKP